MKGCLAGGMGWWCLTTIASAAIHGPVVVWDRLAQSEARVVWVEEAKPEEGGEGSWFTGAAGFGYGDDDDGSVFPGMKGKYDSLAIRCRVDLPDSLPGDAVLVLEVDYDDGFVAWLGGKEVVRRNVAEKNGRMQAAKSHEAGRPEAVRLGLRKDLVEGKTAVLALQGFNEKVDSSDFSLHPKLVAVVGTKRVELVPRGADWECLAGDLPDPLWQTRTSLKRRTDQKGEAGLRCIDVKEGMVAIRWGESHRFGDTRHRVHVVRLTDLKADTEYAVQLFPAGRPLEAKAAAQWPLRFRTAPGEFRPFTFVAGGDMYHRRDLLDAMNRRAGAEDPLFALLGGDLAYCNGLDSKRWLDWLDSWASHARTSDGRMVPMVTAIGNHEVKGIAYSPANPPDISQATYYRSLFLDEGQEAMHCVDFGDYMSLVLLDSGHAAPVKPQAAFIRKALADRSGVPRLFVCYHRPAYGAGAKEDAKEIVEHWCPVFEQNRVDAVFENDHHVFKRTLPILGGKVAEKDGIPYVGDGAWGVDVRKIDPAAVKKRPWIAKADAVNHLHRVEVTQERFRITSKKADGTVIDDFERTWRRAK